MNSEKEFNIDKFKKAYSSNLDFLKSLVETPSQLTYLSEEERKTLFIYAGKLSRPDRKEQRERRKAIRLESKKISKRKEKEIRKLTGIRSARESKFFEAPLMIDFKTKDDMIVGELPTSRNCYVCKKEYKKLHFFYDTMCPDCADFNYKKRFQTADLKGQIAVITGSRLKIGYHATLMLLRAGATVIATTRFPVDSSKRFAKEKDFMQWGNRLHIYGLDLRHTPSVEMFTNYITQKFKRLDILINNAAQTVRRPPGFYAHLMANESLSYNDLSKREQMLMAQYRECVGDINSHIVEKEEDKLLPVSWGSKKLGLGLTSSAILSQVPYSHDASLSVEEVFPKGELDADMQQIDLRKTNSWRLTLGQIDTSEMMELQLVNSIAPFVLCNNFAELMKKDYTGNKHMINVSAMEGKFLKFKKGERHPHTNMAKAALNMLTHTSASGLAKHGIFMNAVDTGWVTDEDPAKLSKIKQDIHDFQPPLDIVDGAARVLDPLFDGINRGEHWSGQFLKDYFPIDW